MDLEEMPLKEFGCLLHYRAGWKGALWNLSSLFNATESPLPFLLAHRQASCSKSLLREEAEKLFAAESQILAVDFDEVVSSIRTQANFLMLG